ncbi:hypothetical protein DVH05_010657 [Phytophthora capsici]|nr:hypothetical protein DVH05_010657 [Phytophthora capsici]
MPRLDKELREGESDAESQRVKARRTGDQDDNQRDMNYEANGELYRMNLHDQGENQLNGLQPQYGRDQQTMRFRDEMNRAQDLQDGRFEVEPPLYRRISLQVPEEQENTDSSRDPSTDNGESSGNSHEEAQQWSDTEDTNGSVPMETNDESQKEVSCRVTWCEQVGKRYGLCWAHGGVKKCCHRNCPKIALEPGEFCSIHDRQVSTSTFF